MDTNMEQEGRGMELKVGTSGASLRQIGVLLALVFVVALAVVVVKEMSSEAMAVVIGVVCGVSAGIPTSGLMLVVLTRRDRQKAEEAESLARRDSTPPVVVIQGGGAHSLPLGPQAGYWPMPQPGPTARRQFEVVGSSDLLLDNGS
jgi:hypothetical protein